jgi:YYY domain-containing protein
VAFNLAVAMIFALSAIGAYGVVYDLLLGTTVPQSSKSTSRTGTTVPHRPSAPRNYCSAYALFGPFFLLIISNLEGFLHSIHTRGILWGYNAAGQLTSNFWKWLDIKDLNQPPAQPFTWAPTQFWWWWRASRVLQDYDLTGHVKEIIDEFPFFSYLLGDLHPHVLAMPFALLAIALSLNLSLGGGRGQFGITVPLGTTVPLLFGALTLGGLAFLNTWDFPIYLILFCGAYLLGRVEEGRSGLARELLLLGFALGVSGALLYLPFYLGFSSQAGGVLPNLLNPTRGAHLWVMFGSLLLPIFAFLWYAWRHNGDSERLKKGLMLTLGGIVILLGLSLLLGWAITRLGELGNLFLDTLGARGQAGALFREAFVRRLSSAGGWLTLSVLLVMTIGLLWPKRNYCSASSPPNSSATSTLPLFPLLLLLLGGLLVLAPDFFFLRDQFGWRMNTIFKFYFQAWILWSLAAAWATATLLQTLRGGWGWAFRLGMIGVVGMALFYPFMALQNKTNGFDPPQGFTLDGGAYLERQTPDEMAAIRWLRAAPAGVVLEAVGGSYTSAGRVSAYSGQPTVLGWPGHESQWRGGARGWESRQADVETIYRSSDWEAVLALLRKYDVRYVFIGALERTTYRVSETKFQRFLVPAFQQGQATIYTVP